MKKATFLQAEIILPNSGVNLEKWAVVACDQYTSEPEYWQNADKIVGDAPSTLRIILPEAFLEGADVQQRIKKTHSLMNEYLQNILTKQINGFIYIEREIENDVVRQGLVGCIDLEDYSYEKNANVNVRPSEGTVVERIPSRLAMRTDAKIECPHILMLIDDRNNEVIEPFAKKKENLENLYNENLMLGGGKISGWAVTKSEDLKQIENAILKLGNSNLFAEKYGINGETPFTFIVGDGNHSLAAAKAYWENLKKNLSLSQQQNHPARFCLVELGNLQSAAYEIEPIHRVLFNVSSASVLRGMALYANAVGAQLEPYKKGDDGQKFVFCFNDKKVPMTLKNSPFTLEYEGLEKFLEIYAEDHKEMQIDYVHGQEVVEKLVKKGAVGILMPAIKKENLFKGVALGGVLPKKSFSLGHSAQKRYYMECKKISI